MNKIKRYRIFLVIILLFIFECTFMKNTLAEVVFSPSENISINFFLKNGGSPNYFVKYKDKTIIDTSSMGFDFKNLQSFDQGFKIIEVKKKTNPTTGEFDKEKIEELMERPYNYKFGLFLRIDLDDEDDILKWFP